MYVNHLYLKFCNFELLCFFYVLIGLSLYSTHGLKCGEYGFVCINDKYFKKCDDKFIRELPKEVIYKCPENTICNERFKRACNVDNQTTTELELKETLTELSPQEEEQITDVVKADIKDEKAHSNMTAETAKLSTPVKSGKMDSKPACPPETRFKRSYYCPTEGAFVNGRNDRYFYICYRDRKSIDNKLYALPLQCPNGMIFDAKSQKCVQPYKVMVYKIPHKRKYTKYN